MNAEAAAAAREATPRKMCVCVCVPVVCSSEQTNAPPPARLCSGLHSRLNDSHLHWVIVATCNRHEHARLCI